MFYSDHNFKKFFRGGKWKYSLTY